MFITKVALSKADKIFTKRKELRREGMAVTFIYNEDIRFWDRADWLFMLDNKKFSTADGFYISATLFKGDDVSESRQEKVSESTAPASVGVS